jgi:hypothetical protein
MFHKLRMNDLNVHKLNSFEYEKSDETSHFSLKLNKNLNKH